MVEIIYELGINHNGNLSDAKKMIDIASNAGCHYVKFQKRNINTVYSKEELDTPRESPWGTTTREQKEGLEFGLLDYHEIDGYCRSKNIKWFASPWDSGSLHFLVNNFDMPFIKIPSALLTNELFLQNYNNLKYKPKCIFSTGMSSEEDIDHAIDILGEDNIYSIMHCTSTYPTKPEEINAKWILNSRNYLRGSNIKLGFSNHYPGLMAMILAIAYGAEVVEFHGTLDRTMYGSDQAASIEPQGVFELVKRIKLMEAMMGDGIKKIYESEFPIMKKLRG